jgi:hypothetical protein
VWCFQRFGQSTTTLDDGRKLYIAGEHEDYYDPDFYIYNDVVLENPAGDISVYGYPKAIFPPTDFHSATLTGEHVVIAGNLGYPADRKRNETQILRLNLKNFGMERISGSGDAPGWAHAHSAALSEDGQKLLVTGGLVYRGEEKALWENIDEWQLDLTNWIWTRITDRNWQRWVFVKEDRKPNRLSRLRNLLWYRQRVYWKDKFKNDLEALTLEMEYEPDLDLLLQLYIVDNTVVEIPSGEEEHDIFRVLMDNTVVRFKEGGRGIHAMVEGRLSSDRLGTLQISICDKLAKITGTAWEIEAP